MKKIVFLGCENSHSKQFIGYINEDEKYNDIEIVGVHSLLDKKAEEDLANQFSLKRLNDYSDAKDEVEGVIVTSRHGGYHLEFVKPYLKPGMTAYVDKPVTISEEDALELAKLAKKNNVKLTGQSSLILDENVEELRKLVAKKGTLGGFVRAPINLNNPHGGFYFYSEHLVDMVLHIFGWYPNSVIANEYKDQVTVTFKYDDFEVTGLFGIDNYVYGAAVYTKEGNVYKDIVVTGGEKCFKDHFDEFYETMKSDTNSTDYKRFIAPVFVLNAIERSMKSHKEETVRRFEI